MPLRKTSFAVPEQILRAVDRAAGERGESRSAFITRVLRTALRARRDADITRRLERVFLDESLQEEQRRTAAQLDEFGSDWSLERW